jgi:hypothetical protein
LSDSVNKITHLHFFSFIVEEEEEEEKEMENVKEGSAAFLIALENKRAIKVGSFSLVLLSWS